MSLYSEFVFKNKQTPSINSSLVQLAERHYLSLITYQNQGQEIKETITTYQAQQQAAKEKIIPPSYQKHLLSYLRFL